MIFCYYICVEYAEVSKILSESRHRLGLAQPCKNCGHFYLARVDALHVLLMNILYAGVAELADALDSGSSEAIRVGSSPVTCTRKSLNRLA